MAHAIEFQWPKLPAAAALVDELLAEFVRRVPFVAAFAAKARTETGTQLRDWVARIAVPADCGLAPRLEETGFARRERPMDRVWEHPEGLFPPVEAADRWRLFLKAESLSSFLAAFGSAPAIEGEPFASVRRARVAAAEDAECWIVERRGTQDVGPAGAAPPPAAIVLRHAGAFQTRRREFAGDVAGFDHAAELFRAAAGDLGRDRACDLFFAAEREFWQSRNRAARVQKDRQDALGLGWANHDHHTYRSSRHCFAALIGVLEQMGFLLRERFYAGREAGWGAQVLEQPQAGVVIFADVDLSPEELAGDFAHEPLPPRQQLGTVGLWCALHGEAFLQAGMHHLECQFDFDAARDQLRAAGVESMKPFTDFPHLRQAFTTGEFWPVAERRLAPLVRAGHVSAEKAAEFRTKGALGSHLEILQRNFGYKGFNQTGINEIIAATDPRRS